MHPNGRKGLINNELHTIKTKQREKHYWETKKKNKPILIRKKFKLDSGI